MESTNDPNGIAREIIHRCNNFLTVIATHGETAAAKNEPESLRSALQTIIEESAQIEQFLREQRSRLQGS